MFSRPPKSAIVKQVLSADTFILSTKPASGPPIEMTISLSNINAPKIGSAKEPEKEEAFAFEARNFVRLLLVGKQVRSTVEYATAGGREFGSIQLLVPVDEETDVARLLTKNGYALVRRADGKQLSEEQLVLDALEQEAVITERGMHGFETPQRILRQAFVKEYNGKQIPGVIEQVRDGSTYRVCLFLDTKPRPTHQYITLSLAGVKAPAYRKDIPNLPDIVEPYGAESRYFVETRLLQKDIHVVIEGVSNSAFVGSIIFPLGNISELILSEGFGQIQDWSLSMVSGGSAPLRIAEQRAKERKMRVWKDYVQKPVFVVKTIEATVVKIIQADTVVIEYGFPTREKKISFSSLRAPKQKDDKEIYFNNEAREFLRSRLIGRRVTVSIDYIKPAQETYEERECGTVKIGEQNISESLVSKGLAYVIRHKKEDENRSSTYDLLILAEDKAKAEQRGLFSLKDLPVIRIVDASETLTKARQFFPSLQRSGLISAVVEYCASASRFKLYLPNERMKMSFVVTGIRVPRNSRNDDQGEPFGNEALAFSNKHLLQRDCQVTIESVDKVGGFMGNLFFQPPHLSHKNEQGLNYAVMLLERGFATVHDPSAQSNTHSRQLYETQEQATAAREGVWSVEREEETVVKNDLGDDKALPELHRAIITEVCAEGGGFYIQTHGPDLVKLEAMTHELRMYNATSRPPIQHPKKGDLVCARFSSDQLWYRGRILSIIDADLEILFIDYGSIETLPRSTCRNIHSFGTLPPQAQECQFAFIQVDQCRISGDCTVGTVMKREGVSQVLVYDKEGLVNLGLVRDGLATARRMKLPEVVNEGRISELVTLINEAQEFAKKSRLNMWRYGDCTQDEDL